MPFTKKFSQSGDTITVRVPKCYAELVDELMLTIDSRFGGDTEKAKHILKKFIHNLT